MFWSNDLTLTMSFPLYLFNLCIFILLCNGCTEISKNQNNRANYKSPRSCFDRPSLFAVIRPSRHVKQQKDSVADKQKIIINKRKKKQ